MEILNKHKDGSPKDAVYVGRGAPFGNPYVIGEHGTRDFVIEKYRGYLFSKLINRDPVIEKAFKELDEDSKLLCFCAPKHCHAEVIREYWQIVNQEDNYEKGLENLIASVKIEDKTVSQTYRQWLLDRLLARDPVVTRDFRALELTLDLIPAKFKDEKTGETILELYDELVKDGDYDASLLDLQKNVIGNIPVNDGKDHINIYTKGSTQLGKALSNMSPFPFDHPIDGHFNTVEGYWYWLSTGKVSDVLRTCDGFNSKKLGRTLPRIKLDDFKEKIKEAIRLKIEQRPKLKLAFTESTLPFTHYYYYGTIDNPKIITPNDGEWIVTFLENLRTEYKNASCKVIIAGSRSVENLNTVKEAYQESGFKATEIVSGGARGVDRLGEEIARELSIPVKHFIPDWDNLGKKAGMIRNQAMGDYADKLIAVHDGVSPGTKGMIDYMERLKKPVYIKKALSN